MPTSSLDFLRFAGDSASSAGVPSSESLSPVIPNRLLSEVCHVHFLLCFLCHQNSLFFPAQSPSPFLSRSAWYQMI